MRRLVLAALIAAAPAEASEEDKGFLAGLISKALSSRATQVSVGAVDGALSSDAVIRDVVLSDRDGPWLRIDRAALSWNRLALFKRRLEVERLEIGHISWLRPARKEPAAAPGGPMEWPDLPLKAIVKAFRVESLDLGAPVIGQAARLGFTGSATLGSPSEGLDFAFAGRRLDAPGALDLKLNFTPKTTALTLALAAQEPAGGLLASAAHLPGAPPVTFRFDGAGPLDAFHARLDFAAGPEIGAQGGVDLVRDGAGRRLKLGLTSRLAGLVPALAAPVFAGETKLTGEAQLGDDGSVTTQGIGLESEAASLAVVGGVTAGLQADFAVEAHAKPNERLGRLAFLGAVKGALPRPSVALSLDVQDLKSPAGTLAQASAHFTARPEPTGDPAVELGLAGDAAFAGLKLADPALAALVGEAGRVDLKARATADGSVDVAELKLEAQALRARFVGKAGMEKLDGALDAEAPDLSRLAALTGLKLKGSARAAAKLTGAPGRGDYGAEVKAETQRLGTGIAALDGFTGASPTLTGGVKLTAAAGYGFDRLTLTGAGGAARLDGAAPIRAAITIPDARRLDARVEGEIAATASLAGADLDAKAALTNGRLLGRPARLSLAAQARSGAKLAVQVEGDIDGKPLTGNVAATRGEAALALERLNFALGKFRLDGAGRFAEGLLDGRLTLAAPRLDDLSPLALTPLSGAAEADLGFSAQAGRQNVAIHAKSAEAAFGATRVGGLAVDLKLADLYGDLNAQGSATAARIFAGGETISGLKLNAKGERFDLAATARGLALSARGALRLAAKTLRLDAFRAGDRVALAEPATLTLAEGGVATERLALKLGAGRLSLSGLAGRRLDFTAKADAVPLALADLVSPGLGLTGNASGEARLQGEAAAPAGDWRLALAGLSAQAARNAGLPPLEVKASGRLGQGRTSLEANVSAGTAGAVRVAGSAPLGEGALDLKASGRLDLAPLTRTLAARGQRLSGTVTLDARVTGEPGKPQAEGGATLAGGAFSDDVSGLRLSDLSASLAARGDRIEIARASGHTPGGGSVSASGRIRLEPNFPGEIRLAAENARLVATDIVTAEAGLALEVSGPLASTPRVAGRIDVKALDVEIPGRLPGAAAPLADVKHIAPGPAARRRLALMRKARARGGPAFDAALAIAVSAPSRVTVHGRGVDAEFGGELKIGGTTARPQIAGGFDLRRGSLTLIGGPLSFARGAIRFEGDTLPRLDLEARQTLSDATAIVDVTGPADRPSFTFASSPELPQDEVLSRLLFQKPSGSLSAFQALQLANTIAALSGGGALDSLRRSLGVDSLDVSTGSGGGPVLGARRAIGDRLSLGVKTGAKPQDNGVTLDLDVTKRLRLSTGVDAKGESSVGAGMQWEY